MVITKTGHHDIWAPAAQILFIGQDGTAKAPGFGLSVDHGAAHLKFYDGGGRKTNVTFDSYEWDSRPVSFTTTLTDSLFKVSVRGETKFAVLNNFKLQEVEFICSTGAADFSATATTIP